MKISNLISFKVVDIHPEDMFYGDEKVLNKVFTLLPHGEMYTSDVEDGYLTIDKCVEGLQIGNALPAYHFYAVRIQEV